MVRVKARSPGRERTQPRFRTLSKKRGSKRSCNVRAAFAPVDARAAEPSASGPDPGEIDPEPVEMRPAFVREIGPAIRLRVLPENSVAELDRDPSR